jgi:hypothetical protein
MWRDLRDNQEVLAMALCATELPQRLESPWLVIIIQGAVYLEGDDNDSLDDRIAVVGQGQNRLNRELREEVDGE